MRLFNSRLHSNAPMAKGTISVATPVNASEPLRVKLYDKGRAQAMFGLYLDEADIEELASSLFSIERARVVLLRVAASMRKSYVYDVHQSAARVLEADAEIRTRRAPSTELVPKFNWPGRRRSPANPLVPATSKPQGTVVTEEYLRSIARSEVNDALGIEPEPEPAPPTLTERYQQYRAMLFEQWDMVDAEFQRRVKEADRELRHLAAAEFPEHGWDGDE